MNACEHTCSYIMDEVRIECFKAWLLLKKLCVCYFNSHQLSLLQRCILYYHRHYRMVIKGGTTIICASLCRVERKKQDGAYIQCTVQPRLSGPSWSGPSVIWISCFQTNLMNIIIRHCFKVMNIINDHAAIKTWGKQLKGKSTGIMWIKVSIKDRSPEWNKW